MLTEQLMSCFELFLQIFAKLHKQFPRGIPSTRTLGRGVVSENQLPLNLTVARRRRLTIFQLFREKLFRALFSYSSVAYTFAFIGLPYQREKFHSLSLFTRLRSNVLKQSVTDRNISYPLFFCGTKS